MFNSLKLQTLMKPKIRKGTNLVVQRVNLTRVQIHRLRWQMTKLRYSKLFQTDQDQKVLELQDKTSALLKLYPTMINQLKQMKSSRNGSIICQSNKKSAGYSNLKLQLCLDPLLMKITELNTQKHLKQSYISCRWVGRYFSLLFHQDVTEMDFILSSYPSSLLVS